MFGFGKKRSVTLPFPVTTLDVLPNAFRFGVERALRLSERAEITPQDVWDSSVFNAYVCSFPVAVDRENEQHGGAVRKLLLMRTFEDSEVYAQVRFDRFAASHNSDDETTLTAFACGVEDGKTFFDACSKNKQIPDNFLTNLILLVRASKDFNALRIS